MPRLLTNDYQGTDTLSNADIQRALTGDFEGFKYYFEHCMLIQDRDTRQWIHPKMNAGQEMINRALFKYIDPATRADHHVEFLLVGPRQFGKSTNLTAVSNYIEAYVPGMENLNLVHTLQQKDAARKYLDEKVKPIICNVHPAVFPTIEQSVLSASIQLRYKNIKGIRRGGIYEVLGAGSNSVRSGTVSVWLCDEPSEYRKPEAVEDAVSGAMTEYGWSLTAYIGTFSDKISDYFLNKIKTAIKNPNRIEFVFVPWFLVYGRPGEAEEIDLTEEYLDDYDKNVIIPEMVKYNIPQKEWLDKIAHYHKRALRTANIKYEFPTSIEDILSLTSDRRVFLPESTDKQEKNIMVGKPYRIVKDTATKQLEAQTTDVSPLTIFKPPITGHKYRIAIDPITARSDETDNFVMQVMDLGNNEQVAIFAGNGLQDEDYADWAVNLATIYNKAGLCPESNVANGFIVAVNASKYYHWFYADKKSKANREVGLRTSVATKERFIDKLSTLLDRGSIIIHDRATLDEINDFVKKVKKRSDGGTTVKMEAPSGKHDDRVAALWIYAGSLDNRQIEGRKRSGFAIL